MARHLVKTVMVRDPDSGAPITLAKGFTPPPELAVLVRNPSAWSDDTDDVPDSAPDAGVRVETRVVVSPVPGDRAGYEVLDVPDLEAIADARRVDVTSAADKAEIVDALLAYDDVIWAEFSRLAAEAAGATADGEAAAAAQAEAEAAAAAEAERVEAERVAAEQAAAEKADADKAAAQAKADAKKTGGGKSTAE